MAPAKRTGSSAKKASLPAAAESETAAEETQLETAQHNKVKADKIIRDHIAWACAGGLIPVPLFDIAAITAAQLKLVRELSHLYKVPFQDNLGKNVVASLIGSVGSAAVGRGIFFSVLKAVPVIGSIGGLISVPIVAGASTYALGNVFVEHFEHGGTLFDFKPELMRELFEAKLKEGQEIAREIKDQVVKTINK